MHSVKYMMICSKTYITCIFHVQMKQLGKVSTLAQIYCFFTYLVIVYTTQHKQIINMKH